jgi:hypothetical protein
MSEVERETHVEIRLTGDPVGDFPPYEFTLHADDEEKAAQLAHLLRGTSTFRAGVRNIRLWRRTVTITRTEWAAEPEEQWTGTKEETSDG